MIQDLIKYYRLSNPVILEKLGGFSSKNYHVKDEKSEYILKILNLDQEKIARKVTDIVDYLYAKNIPVAKVINSFDNKKYIMSDQDILILYPKINGVILHGNDLGNKALKNSAKIIAKIHNIKIDQLNLSTYNYEIDDVIKKLENFKNKKHGKIAHLIDLKIKLVKNIFKHSLKEYKENYCLVHGDWHNENIIFDEQQNVKIILDFEEMNLGHPVSDLIHFIIIAIFGCDFSSKNIGRAKFFLRSYLDINNIDYREIKSYFLYYILDFANSLFLEELAIKSELYSNIIEREINKNLYFIKNIDNFIDKII